METQVDQAVHFFRQGFNCAQAVAATYGPQYGLHRATAMAVATGFGGGMRQGSICGAVTGAFIILGLHAAKQTDDPAAAKERAGELVEEFAAEFENRTGALTCPELLGCDITTPKGLEIAETKGLFSSTCPEMVEHAAHVLEYIVGK